MNKSVQDRIKFISALAPLAPLAPVHRSDLTCTTNKPAPAAAAAARLLHILPSHSLQLPPAILFRILMAQNSWQHPFHPHLLAATTFDGSLRLSNHSCETPFLASNLPIWIFEGACLPSGVVCSGWPPSPSYLEGRAMFMRGGGWGGGTVVVLAGGMGLRRWEGVGGGRFLSCYALDMSYSCVSQEQKVQAAADCDKEN